MHSTPKKSNNSAIHSPFVECLSECRSSMRKLRKKIYKHIKYNPDYHKGQPQTVSLIDTLKNRSIPQNLLKVISERRYVNFSSLNDIQIENILPISQVKKCADRQENETKEILQEWKNSLNIQRESKLSKSESKNPIKTQKIWLLSTQMQNEQSDLISRSQQLTPFQGDQLFPKSFEDLNINTDIINPTKQENSLMQICSNIFDESYIYTFK